MAATAGLLGSSEGEGEYDSSSIRVSTRFGESRSMAIRAEGVLEVTSLFRRREGMDLRPERVK